jgi:hypothetical protein
VVAEEIILLAHADRATGTSRVSHHLHQKVGVNESSIYNFNPLPQFRPLDRFLLALLCFLLTIFLSKLIPSILLRTTGLR